MFIYTREAHPGAAWPHHQSLEQKLAHAARAVQRWGLSRPLFVDDLEGSLHRAYGCLPNMAWVIDQRGRIAYRASWTDVRTLDLAVQQLVWEEEQRQNGNRLSPFQCDWAPRRVRDQRGFVAGLLACGPPAFDEFVEAARGSANWPSAAVRELEQIHLDLK